MLEQSPSEITDQSLANCEEILRRGPHGLVDALERFLPGMDRQFFVVVDQFEELFRFTHRDRDSDSREGEMNLQGLDDAIAFVDLLLSTAALKSPQIFAGLTMRSDYLGDCDVFRDLPEAINRSQFLPPRLTREDLRDAIERPPRNPAFEGPEGKSGIDPQVVDELLDAMRDRQDQLPLIQHALMRMWSVAEGPEKLRPAQITPEIMQSCGIGGSSGISGALDQHLDQVYDSLDDGIADDEAKPSRRQEIVHRIFCALCQQGGDGRYVRRVCTVAEIAAMAGKDVTEDEVIELAAKFTKTGRNFLIATPPGEVTGDSDLDISHESLIRNWRRLSRWLDAEEESASIYRRLAESTRLHADDRDEPLVGRALEMATSWFAKEKPTAAWAKRYGKGTLEEVEEYLLLSQQREREREEGDSATQYRLLVESARRYWEGRADLLTGRELELAKEWFEREQPTPEWGESFATGAYEEAIEFLNDSKENEEKHQAAIKKAENEKAEAKERELELAKNLAKAQGRRVIVFRRMMIVAGLVTGIAIVLAIFAFNSRVEAQRQKAVALAAKEKADEARKELENKTIEKDAATLLAGIGWFW